ncbi:MAG: T9SS type A sorting domain-containing protein [Bacteroidetes bacterium]|nr:T9SS type A sorting domain-containing protein [Bacteroidota bacterium]
MKKLLSFLILALSFTIANAQYWQLYYPNAGTNPESLNNDAEYPVGGGLSTTWTTMQGYSATPVWSTNQTIPFSFNFNGSPVTTYKVSTSGILTFDVSTALAAPSYTKAALPNAAIPDKSVCIWGMSAIGTNDNIVTKTFGTAPNRQLWIQFNSYGYGNVASDGSNFTYWSIVLQEGSNRIYIVDNRTGGYATTKQVSAGIQINSSTAYTVPTSPNLNSLATTDPTPADNSFYVFIPGVQPALDAACVSMTPKLLTSQSFALVGGNVPVIAKVQNIGSTAMSTYNIKINDGSTILNFPQTTAIASGNTANISINYPMGSIGTKPIKLWVELTGDTYHANDTVTSEFNGASYTPTHVPVFEEATGTWCQWCPRGAVYMDSLVDLHPDAVAIAVHNGDPMTVADYDAGMGPLIGGYPSGLVDRKYEADPSDFLTEYNNVKGDFGVGDITINQPTVTGSSVSVKVDVKMAISTQSNYNYRLALVITEDDMHGTTSQWNQANAYAGGGAGPMGGYELLPSSVPAAQMYYDHVARVIVGGFEGQTGSLPAVMTAGSTYSYTFNWTAPAGTVLYKCKANALLICGLSKEIHNGNWKGVYPTSVDDIIKVKELTIFPNPSNDYLNVDFTLNETSDVVVVLTDMTGNVVYNNPLKNLTGNQGVVINTSNLSNGMYNLTLRTKQGNVTRKVTIAH